MENLDKDTLLEEIVGALIQDPKIAAESWDHLVMVFEVDQGSVGAHGYAYASDGKWTATGPSFNSNVMDKVEAFQKITRDPGKGPWKACLFRIDRIKESVQVEFEYDNPAKWKVTPKNFEEMPETLRPK